MILRYYRNGFIVDPRGGIAQVRKHMCVHCHAPCPKPRVCWDSHQRASPRRPPPTARWGYRTALVRCTLVRRRQGSWFNVRMAIWAYMGGQARVLVQVCRSSVSLKSGLMVVLHEDETDLSALIAKSLPALSPSARAGFVVLI